MKGFLRYLKIALMAAAAAAVFSCAVFAAGSEYTPITVRAGGRQISSDAWEFRGTPYIALDTFLTYAETDKLEMIGVTKRPRSHSMIYAYLAVVDCEKDAVRLQQGETVGYQWVDPSAFFRMMREEPILKIQYPRYKPYLDRLE